MLCEPLRPSLLLSILLLQVPGLPGYNEESWLIVMDKPGGEGATVLQMVDCYMQTLAQVVGSKDEALKKIYRVVREGKLGFGCVIDDEETLHKLRDIGTDGVKYGRSMPKLYNKDVPNMRMKQAEEAIGALFKAYVALDLCFYSEMQSRVEQVLSELSVHVKKLFNPTMTEAGDHFI